MVRVITDSTASIPRELRSELDIEVISLSINRGDKEYLEAETDLDAFYQDIYEMIDDIPTSSQPSQATVKDAIERIADTGAEVMGVFLSSKMSGTFETFLRIADEVSQERPDFKFAALDSMSNCMETGFAAIAAAKAAQEGKTLEECAKAAEESLMCSKFMFTPESLVFLEKGGRIGKAAALIGQMINLAPILTVKDGEAATLAKTRTQKKAMAKIVKEFEKDIAAYGLKDMVVHYIGSKIPAEKWAEEVINPIIKAKAMVIPASLIIGVHVGPAVGLMYECKKHLPGKYSGAAPKAIYAR